MTALMYHDVVAAGEEDTSGFPGRDAALYKVTPTTFAAQLDAINRSVPRGSAGPDRGTGAGDHVVRTAVITFDDGGRSAMAAADMLEARGRIGHFFITANYIGTRGFLTEEQIRELAARGHVLGSHSCSHPLRMGHCSWPQLLDEWTRSRSILSGVIGVEVRDASVPGGDFAPQVAEAAAAAGITRLFTSEPTIRSREAFGMTVVGRFAIKRWTTAATAAGLAAGAWLPCARQSLLWSAKKFTKRVGGERYLQFRRLVLRHGNDVQWGDFKG